ncbi:MAG: hypothetical protein AB7U35_13295 [Sphingobium sp.]
MADRPMGKAAIVTGAGTRGQAVGNGRACAIVCACEDANVVAADIDMETAHTTAEQITDDAAQSRWWWCVRAPPGAAR